MKKPAAVVVGACAHGLALVRALYRAGLDVYALEANRSLPGCLTKMASLRFVEDINGPGLLQALIKLAPHFSRNGKPVLFLTNDAMVSTVGQSWRDIQDLYELSWAESRDSLIPLLRKSNIEHRCDSTGLAYPKSATLSKSCEVENKIQELQFPLLLKPDRPLSGFKTHIVHSNRELMQILRSLDSSNPIVVQEYISGGEHQIQFAAVYLDDGRVVARFEGRKLRSRPMGHTTVAVSEPCDEIHELACRFFQGLKLSGPCSLELKKAPSGRYLVIEPTVGRTDFWVGLCISDGVSLPEIEYRHCVSMGYGEMSQTQRCVWINGERDPGALFWLASSYPRLIRDKKVVGVYVDKGDWRPWLRWLTSFSAAIPKKVARLLRKQLWSTRRLAK